MTETVGDIECPSCKTTLVTFGNGTLTFHGTVGVEITDLKDKRGSIACFKCGKKVPVYLPSLGMN